MLTSIKPIVLSTAHPSGAVENGKILLGGLIGAVAGIVFGAVVYGSLVVAIFGGMVGAMSGMIAAAKGMEA